ncbi:MAG: DegV family protein [Gemmatimonadales bacterium]
MAAGRDELNRLNVFPVPDGDTGTNLCLTLREVAQALRDLGDAPLPRVAEAMASASVRGTRGNSGMLLSQFLLRLRDDFARVRDQSGGFFTVDNFERLVRSGRVGRVRAWLGTRLNMKPIMALSRDGTVDPVGRARGRPTLLRRVLELLERALAGRPRQLRLAVAHADIPALAEELRDTLVTRYRPKQCLVGPITPVIAAHAGIGAWGVLFQIEDGTNG